MAIGDTSRDLQLEDRKGISHVNEYTYLFGGKNNQRWKS